MSRCGNVERLALFFGERTTLYPLDLSSLEAFNGWPFRLLLV